MAKKWDAQSATLSIPCNVDLSEQTTRSPLPSGGRNAWGPLDKAIRPTPSTKVRTQAQTVETTPPKSLSSDFNTRDQPNQPAAPTHSSTSPRTEAQLVQQSSSIPSSGDPDTRKQSSDSVMPMLSNSLSTQIQHTTQTTVPTVSTSGVHSWRLFAQAARQRSNSVKDPAQSDTPDKPTPSMESAKSYGQAINTTEQIPSGIKTRAQPNPRAVPKLSTIKTHMRQYSRIATASSTPSLYKNMITSPVKSVFFSCD
ncbi:hypothetical protein BDF14DRAFT_1197613 [Spinellus fusiger]|nr:hypothetical protein BDF14DRAFT_1197613 [Spinellus fusiger]